MEGYVPVKWSRPGSRYDGVVQYVPENLVDVEPGQALATVWWPSRKAKAAWKAILVPTEKAPPPLKEKKKRRGNDGKLP